MEYPRPSERQYQWAERYMMEKRMAADNKKPRPCIQVQE